MESKQAFNESLEVLKDADRTFLDPEANLDEQGKVDGYHHFFDRPSPTESELSIVNTNPQPPALPLTDAQLARHIRTIAMFFQCTTWIAPLAAG